MILTEIQATSVPVTTSSVYDCNGIRDPCAATLLVVTLDITMVALDVLVIMT